MFVAIYRGYLLVDPSLTEETVMEGRLVIGMNVHREICVLGMAGGFALLPDQVKSVCVCENSIIILYSC